MAKYLDATGLGQVWEKVGLTFLSKGGGAVTSSAAQIFSLNSTSTNGNSYITFKSGGVDRSEVGYDTEIGTYLKNFSNSKILNITNTGDLLFDGKAILTEANIPSAAVDLANMWVMITTAVDDATQALDLATKHETDLSNINKESVLDLSEKDSINTVWITINGINRLDSVGTSGSYYITKTQANKYASSANNEIFIWNTNSYTYNGVVYTYKSTNLGELDTAYQELRDFLRTSEISDRTKVYKNFDRARFSELLKNYKDAEIKVRGSIEDAIVNSCSTTYITISNNLSNTEIDTIIV